MGTKHQTVFEVEKGNRTLWRRAMVEQVTGLGRSSIYQKMANSTFPIAVSLGGKAVAWVKSEVLNWVDSRIAERDSNVSNKAERV